MDTPEKEKFLETVRDLRKEAEEKLTGNRHFLAVQKLDEIIEAVEKSGLSSEEINAVNDVLMGKDDVVAASVGSSPATELDPKNLGGAALASVAAGAIVGQSSLEASDNVEIIAEQDAMATVDQSSQSNEKETTTLETTTLETVSPEETGQENASLEADSGGGVLSNWWKRKGGETQAVGANTAEVVEGEIADTIEADENGVDLASVASGATATVATVAGATSAGLVSEDIVEEIQLIDVPEVEIEPANIDLPTISVEAAGSDIEVQHDISEPDLNVDIVKAPEVNPPAEIITKTAEPEVELETQVDLTDPSKLDLGAQAAAAAAAVATVGAVSMSASNESPTEAVDPTAIVAKSSTSHAAVIEEVSETASVAPVLTGDDIARHPSYGARGGMVTRFFNTLRGRDYL